MADEIVTRPHADSMQVTRRRLEKRNSGYISRTNDTIVCDNDGIPIVYVQKSNVIQMNDEHVSPLKSSLKKSDESCDDNNDDDDLSEIVDVEQLQRLRSGEHISDERRRGLRPLKPVVEEHADDEDIDTADGGWGNIATRPIADSVWLTKKRIMSKESGNGGDDNGPPLPVVVVRQQKKKPSSSQTLPLRSSLKTKKETTTSEQPSQPPKRSALKHADDCGPVNTGGGVRTVGVGGRVKKVDSVLVTRRRKGVKHTTESEPLTEAEVAARAVASVMSGGRSKMDSVLVTRHRRLKKNVMNGKSSSVDVSEDVVENGGVTEIHQAVDNTLSVDSSPNLTGEKFLESEKIHNLEVDVDEHHHHHSVKAYDGTFSTELQTEQQQMRIRNDDATHTTVIKYDEIESRTSRCHDMLVQCWKWLLCRKHRSASWRVSRSRCEAENQSQDDDNEEDVVHMNEVVVSNGLTSRSASVSNQEQYTNRKLTVDVDEGVAANSVRHVYGVGASLRRMRDITATSQRQASNTYVSLEHEKSLARIAENQKLRNTQELVDEDGNDDDEQESSMRNGADDGGEADGPTKVERGRDVQQRTQQRGKQQQLGSVSNLPWVKNKVDRKYDKPWRSGVRRKWSEPPLPQPQSPSNPT